MQEAATITQQEQLPQLRLLLPLPPLQVALQGSLQMATKTLMQAPLTKMTCWLTWTWTGLRLSTGAHRHQRALAAPCSTMAGSSSSSHGSSRMAQAAGSSSSSNMVVTTAQQAVALQGRVLMASALATGQVHVQVLVPQGHQVATALQTSSNSLVLVARMALAAQHSHRGHMAAVEQEQELAPAAMAAAVPAAMAAMTLASMAAVALAAMA